jgi:hypothetical protein
MKTSLPFAASLAVLVVLLARASAQPVDETQEPALKYILHVDGKQVAIEEDKPFDLTGDFSNPRLKLVVDSARVFPYRGVTFKYPRHFSFEGSISDRSAQSWTLSGNDFKIMLFDLQGDVSSSSFAAEMLDQFGKDKAKIVDRDVAITLGKETIKGTRLRVTLVSHTMAIDIFHLAFREGRTQLFVLQDSVDDKGRPSKEGAAALSLLKASFARQK